MRPDLRVHHHTGLVEVLAELHIDLEADPVALRIDRVVGQMELRTGRAVGQVALHTDLEEGHRIGPEVDLDCSGPGEVLMAGLHRDQSITQCKQTQCTCNDIEI